MAITFRKITRANQRRLPTDDELIENGITFKKKTNGDGVYTINVMVDGQRIHRVVGRESDGTTRTQAEEFIAKIRADAKNDRLALPKGRKVALSFREAAAKYLDRLKHEGGLSIPKKHQQLEQHLVPFFADRPLSKINGFDVERYKKLRRAQSAIKSSAPGRGRTFKDKGATPATINRELAVLSHLFNKGIEWSWIDRRPAKINRFKEGNGRIFYLTIEQAKALIECAKADACAQIYPFVVIGLGTSMRKMEILSIRKDHVDSDRRLIHIPKAKSGAREQPITAHVAEFLRSHIKGLDNVTPWLFPSASAKEGHTTDIRKPFRRVVVAAGLNPDEVVRHTLRHTAITHLVQAGVDLPTVKRISGHKTLVMVERYAHQNGAHISAAMQRLEARYAVGDSSENSDQISFASARTNSNSTL